MYSNPRSARVNSALPTAWGLRLAVSAGLVLAMSMPVWAMEDGTTGRWLTRDPLGYVDGMNMYDYLLNNPLAWLDHDGLVSRKCTGDKPQPDPLPFFDPSNPCHMACKTGMTDCRSRGGSQPECEACYERCLDHCKRKNDEGFTLSSEHGFEFWEYDSQCSSLVNLTPIIAGMRNINKGRGDDPLYDLAKKDLEKRLEDAKKTKDKKLVKRINRIMKEKGFKHSTVKKTAKKVGKKAAKGAAGKVVIIGVGFFAYDWYCGGFGHAFNEATWPLSELWCD